jgi:hypothetical protein
VTLLVVFAAMLGLSLSQTPPVQVPAPTSPSGAIADVSGPGQAVARPAAQCPRAVACNYSERTFLPNGYRVQSLEVCGANCATQYWVSASADNRQLLELDPVRAGAIIAVGSSQPGETHPQVRVVMARYAANDPACCPSGYADTTYTFDAAGNRLVAGQPTLTPSADFQGWDAVRQELIAEGFTLTAD